MFLLCMTVQGQEFTEQYMVEYQREDDGRWFRFHNRRRHEVGSLCITVFCKYTCDRVTVNRVSYRPTSYC